MATSRVERLDLVSDEIGAWAKCVEGNVERFPLCLAAHVTDRTSRGGLLL